MTSEGLSSSVGLIFCVVAWVVGFPLGICVYAMLRLLGQHASVAGTNQWRVAAVCMVSIFVYGIGFNGAVNFLVFHHSWVIGTFWAFIYPPLIAWGVASGYAFWHKASGDAGFPQFPVKPEDE